MAGCMLRDRLEELWLHIEQLHLTYLEADKSPRKLEEKNRLEVYIREYLCIAPHDRKFCLEATKEVLRRSVESKEDFSAFRATVAWTAIATYAHNLLTQPWRKEYHEIKTYCGYYKHHVESGLVGAELMLEAMGYKHSGWSTLVLDGPVDPDRVSIVSQDSLIALVECQIMRSIYAEVLKTIQTCSWFDVLQYREQHTGSPEHAIRCLNYRLHQRMYEEQYRPHVDNCSGVARYHHPYPYPYTTQRYYNYTAQPQRYSVVSPAQPYAHPHYHIKPHEQYATSYGYYPVKNGCIPYSVPPTPVIPPSYPCAVPTAQLIELDPPDEPVNAHRRSSSDHRIEADYRKNGDRYRSDAYSRSTTSDDVSSKKANKNRDWESWEFVYRTLEGKRGAEDGGAAQEKYGRRESKNDTLSPLELEDALKAFSLDNLHQITVPEQRLMKFNDALTKMKDCEETDSSKKDDPNNRVSLYDNSSPPVSDGPKQAQIVARDTKKADDPNKFSSVDARKLRVKLNDEKWECVACTYHNSPGKDVCEMCSKSRKMGNEVKPLASGGRQCPNCTLINEKGVTKCEVCGKSLKDSPTYI